MKRRFEIDIGVGTVDSAVNFNSALDRSYLNNLPSDYKISGFVFVANANCLHINICSYHDPITQYAPSIPLGSPAQNT
jgi:hypothetical protein